MKTTKPARTLVVISSLRSAATALVFLVAATAGSYSTHAHAGSGVADASLNYYKQEWRKSYSKVTGTLECAEDSPGGQCLLQVRESGTGKAIRVNDQQQFVHDMFERGVRNVHLEGEMKDSTLNVKVVEAN